MNRILSCPVCLALALALYPAAAAFAGQIIDINVSIGSNSAYGNGTPPNGSYSNPSIL